MKFPLLLSLIFWFALSISSIGAQTKKPFSVSISFGRTAKFERKFEVKQFNFSVILSVPISKISKKLSWNFSVTKPLDVAPATYKTSFNLRIF